MPFIPDKPKSSFVPDSPEADKPNPFKPADKIEQAEKTSDPDVMFKGPNKVIRYSHLEEDLGMSPKYAAMMKKTREQVETPEGAQQVGIQALIGPGLGILPKIGKGIASGAVVAKRTLPMLGEDAGTYSNKLTEVLEQKLGHRPIQVGDKLKTAVEAVEQYFEKNPATKFQASKAIKAVSPEAKELIAQKQSEIIGRNVGLGGIALGPALAKLTGKPELLSLAATGPVVGGGREFLRQMLKPRVVPGEASSLMEKAAGGAEKTLANILAEIYKEKQQKPEEEQAPTPVPALPQR